MERTARAAAVIFFSPDRFTRGSSLTLGDDAAQHARVLRLNAGDAVEIRDGQGSAGNGTIARLSKRSLGIDIADVWTIPQLPAVHMLVPVADRDRMLYLAEKCTELCATSWRPVIWRRSRSVGPAGDGPAFQSRLKSRMIAALAQSGGGWLPEVHPSAPLSRAVAAAPAGKRFLLDVQASNGLIGGGMSEPVSLAVGPEGGIDENERRELIEAGFEPVFLVGATLRFETAGTAGLALVRAMLGNTAASQPPTEEG